ncbi:cilia- and flagella-associated protein 46 isoform X2 [Ambystoma mexicanum]|uniref:cilia- and flagella-associated protein 46 isoform X2 n=1 Tax=Ambystoma mexicanum TaxID=8296 RepID=UPI0037E734A9
MDVLIRQHLSAAQNEQGTYSLKQAYKSLKEASTEKSAIDSSDSFSSDLYILCAEQALQMGDLEISQDCLQMYFKVEAHSNQFLGRAYLCQAQLLAPLSLDKLDQLKKCVGFFLKAVEFAKPEKRYHFLIYNASVLFWQMARPFLNSGYRRLLIPGLTEILKALEQVEDQDSEWRAELMLELLECMLDAQRLKEAATLASTASEYIKNNAPHKYQQLFSMMVFHKLMDSTKAATEMKGSVKLSLIYKLQKIRFQWQSKSSSKDTTTNLNEVYKLLQNADEETPSDLTSDEKLSFLLELARLCLELNFTQLAFTCISDLNNSNIKDPRTLIEVECLECEYEVQKLGANITTYSKGVVESQLKLIKRIELALESAARLADPNIIQVTCASLWNLCLPLLQHNLRKHLRKPLIRIAEILEEIDSSLIRLRCEVHLELARIEEDEDRIEIALEHIKKAMLLDKGQYQDQLKIAHHHLNLCATLYKKPERAEDQAVMILEQAKRGSEKDAVRKKRSLLVNACLALAAHEFQMVLDSENEAKVSTGKNGKGQISFLCMKAQHHTACVQKAAEHLANIGNQNAEERVRLWASLAKVARKQEVWDVCRAACRFCLLYDDGRWKIQKADNLPKKSSSTIKVDDSRASLLENASSIIKLQQSFSPEREFLRMLAEIRFVNAEATIHLLRSEGCLLNNLPVPPEDKSKRPMGYVVKSVDEDPEWIIYRDWIKSLSQYATENFLRAAEIGVELDEAWITHNSVVYILNHNKHLIVTGRQAELVSTLQVLLNAIKQTGHHGNTVLLIILANTLAQGLVFPWIPASNQKEEAPPPVEKGKKAAGKGSAKVNAVQLLSVDPNALPDLKTALEVCEFALELTNGKLPDEVVPIATRLQIITTWVKLKHLLQQQIGPQLGTDDENNDEGQNPMTKVLVALEMYSCNGLGFMDFTVPTLSQLEKMSSECIWSDRLVELQTLVRIAHFSYNSHDYELAKSCCQRALKLNACIVHMKKSEIHNYTLELEMLSTAGCILGQSIMETLDGKKHLHMLALKAFHTSASYAGEAGNMELVMKAAKHFWNACLSFLNSPAERKDLQESTMCILKAFKNAESKNKQKDSAPLLSHDACIGLFSEPARFSGSRRASRQSSSERLKVLREADQKATQQVTQKDATHLHLWPTMDLQITGEADSNSSSDAATADEDLAVRVALYGLLFHINGDKGEWETGLKVLDEAIQILPRNKHKLLIFKHRVLVNARLGCNYLLDIQKFKDESEGNVSYTWHLVARTSKDTAEQLSCYQNAINALQTPASEWQKVDYLIDLAEWMYFKLFPVTDALSQLEWAMDILLKMKLTKSVDNEEKTLKVKSKSRSKHSSAKDLKKEDPKQLDSEGDTRTGDLGLADSTLGSEEQVTIPSNTMDDFSNVRQLEYLARIHTIMAFMAGHSSPLHLQHCMMAYAYIIRIWQVSLPAAGAAIKILAKNTPQSASQNPQSASSKKGKGKKEAKQVQAVPVREKPKRKGPIDALPISVEEWAGYDCPDEVRDAFKTDTSCCAINRSNISKPTYSLYYMDLLVKELQSISLAHLSIPVLQLAEVIAHDVVESKSLSDLYHLRIAEVCDDLRLSQSASYHEKAVGVFIAETEQVICRQEIALHKIKMQCPYQDGKAGIDEEDCDPHTSDKEKKSFKYKEKILELDSTTGKGLSGLSLPYLWMEKSDILIQRGLYQPARLLLSEAHKATREISDNNAVSRCLYLLAVLADKENNHGQAKALLAEAQNTEANAEFWYNVTLGLVHAVLGEQKEEKEKKACTILQTTINAFKEMLHGRFNRRSELAFFISSLEIRKIMIQTQSAQELIAVDTTYSQGAAMLLEACDKMGQIEKDLLEDGYKEKSAQVIMQRANTLRLLAKHTDDEERKHCYYVDAFTQAQRAVYAEEEVFSDVQSLVAAQEIRGISLPIMRRIATMKVSLVDITLEMLELISIERQKKILLDKQKGSMHKVIEEFVQSAQEYKATDQEWITTARLLGHAALAHLESVQALHPTCTDMKSQCLYLTGKCLRLLAEKVDPLNPDVYWNEDILDGTKLSTEISPKPEDELPEKNGTFGDAQINFKRTANPKKAKELRVRRTLAQKYLSQATEVLLQSMNIAMNNNIISTLAAASLETVSCFGNLDPGSAGQYLALHQSCSASIMMEEILLTATSNTSSSQMAALVHLHRHLKEKGDFTSSIFKGVEQRLTAISKAWENLLIQSQHMNIVNELPPNFNVIIMQHSEDRSFLYGAVLEKSKSNIVQKGKLSQQCMRPKVIRCAVDSNLLFDLLKKMHQYKLDVAQALLKKEYQQSIHLQRTGFENMQAAAPNNILLTENTEDEDQKRLSSYFCEVVEAMEAYLKPLLEQLNFSCFSQPTLSPLVVESPKIKAQSPKMKAKEKDDKSTTEPVKGKPKEKEDKPMTAQGTPSPSAEMGECVVLLVDKVLMELPLEALSALQEEGISSVSRDFSLQLLYNRFQKKEPENEAKRDAKSAKGAKSKPDSKKKMASMNRDLPPNCVQVDTNSFKYIVDPYHEAQELELVSPAHKMKEVLEKHHPLTHNWEGFVGSQRVPSHAEWEQLLNNCSAFLFYGNERFLSHVLVEKIVAMNFSDKKQTPQAKGGVGHSGEKKECQLMILLDLVQTNQSFLRQSNLDAERSILDISLEKPVETAVLLSLAGVRSIMANLWHTTLEQNAKRLLSLTDNLLGIGKTTGQTVHDLRKIGMPQLLVKMNEEFHQESRDALLSPDPLDAPAPQPDAFGYILYGLPNVVVT